MSKDTAEALAEAHEAYVAALLAHVTDEGGGEAAEDEPDDDDPQAERKAELDKQTVTELRKVAKAAGASAKDIKDCGTGADGKGALVALILTLEEPDPEGGTDDDGGATDEDAPPAKSKKDKKKDKKKNKK